MNVCVQAGAWSEPVEVRSGNAPPDAPEAPHCIPRGGQVMACTWNEPKCNGGPVTDYRLEMGHGATPTFTIVYQGAQTSCDVKSIPPAALSLFRVQVSQLLTLKVVCLYLVYAKYNFVIYIFVCVI